jgi:hypothetical protein
VGVSGKRKKVFYLEGGVINSFRYLIKLKSPPLASPPHPPTPLFKGGSRGDREGIERG